MKTPPLSRTLKALEASIRYYSDRLADALVTKVEQQGREVYEVRFRCFDETKNPLIGKGLSIGEAFRRAMKKRDSMRIRNPSSYHPQAMIFKRIDRTRWLAIHTDDCINAIRTELPGEYSKPTLISLISAPKCDTLAPRVVWNGKKC